MTLLTITAVMFDRFEQVRENNSNMKGEARASTCTRCLECEEKCPQEVQIGEWMACTDGEFAHADFP